MEKKTQEENLTQKKPEQTEDAELLDEAVEASAAPEKPAAAAETRPLVVCDANGGFLFFAVTTRKGYTKSIEQGSLWVSHPDTDKILPSGKEARLKLIEDRAGYYYAEVFVGEAMEKPASRPESPAPASVSVPDGILAELAALIARRRKEKTEGSYTAYLFQEGIEKIRKKTGEEAVELILARAPHDIVYEAADLLYHLLVLLEAENIPLADVFEELKSRR